jgi:hypothetical protein
MSQVKGRLVTCDRCATSVFSKTTGDDESDGGFTRWNKFEPLPKGWGSHKGNDLCPSCYNEWNKIETSFLNREIEFMRGVGEND